MEALGINLGYLLVQVFNFLIILVVLNRWVYPPIVNLLETRRARIAQGLEDARVAAEARENAEEEARRIIAEAQATANQRVREATERAEQAGRDAMTAAEADVTRAKESALEEARQERERVLGDLRGQVAALAMAAAQKLVGDALDEQRQRSLIQQFFSGVQAGQVTVLEGAEVSGQSAEVTSALPLTPEEKETVRQQVLTRLGGEQATVTFRVDPAILGGLIIRVGDKVLDGSVAGQLNDMRQFVR